MCHDMCNPFHPRISGTEDGRTPDEQDPSRCLVRLLRSRRVSAQALSQAEQRLRRLLPSASQVRLHEAGAPEAEGGLSNWNKVRVGG